MNKVLCEQDGRAANVGNENGLHGGSTTELSLEGWTGVC